MCIGVPSGAKDSIKYLVMKGLVFFFLWFGGVGDEDVDADDVGDGLVDDDEGEPIDTTGFVSPRALFWRE